MKQGRKNDLSKTRWDLVPLVAVEQVAKVLTFGAVKYEANSWQRLENAESRYQAALLRHLTLWQDGEAIDQESGLPHLAHVACNAIFLLWFEIKKGGSNG